MGYVKLSLLNYADYPEFPDRTVGVRTCATSYASRGLHTFFKLSPPTGSGPNSRGRSFSSSLWLCLRGLSQGPHRVGRDTNVRVRWNRTHVWCNLRTEVQCFATGPPRPQSIYSKGLDLGCKKIRYSLDTLYVGNAHPGQPPLASQCTSQGQTNLPPKWLQLCQPGSQRLITWFPPSNS